MRVSARRVLTGLLILGGISTLTQFLRFFLPCWQPSQGAGEPVTVLVRDGWRVSSDVPLVFVGGVPRSGTTLMRAMLDAHPAVRCGEETRVVPRILGLKLGWAAEKEGVSTKVLDRAVTAFLLQIIAGHGESAPLLCNKDPFTLKSAKYLAHLFPNSKFLLMLRDGRAAVHSMISRRVTIGGFDLSSYRDCLAKWSRATQAMLTQCTQVGSKRCLAVRYESLVLHPRSTLQTVLTFLGLPWHEGVLHHEEAIGKPGGVSLSKCVSVNVREGDKAMLHHKDSEESCCFGVCLLCVCLCHRTERSTDQVMRPVNLDALTRWVGHMPPDVMADMDAIAPMLGRLGYDPRANPPNYGQPDPQFLNNTQRLLRGDFKTPVASLHLKGRPQMSMKGSQTER